jgi:hypothetical protein
MPAQVRRTTEPFREEHVEIREHLAEIREHLAN